MTQTAPGDTVAEAPSGMPRGLVVVLAVTGLLVSTLALQQFRAILAPVLRALVLVLSGGADQPPLVVEHLATEAARLGR